MSIECVISPRQKDIGGFFVRRVLPYAERRMVGPWIFFDHMGPAEFAAGKGIDVRPHPHINLATVTYLFEGEILHRDSLGSLESIHPGDINLMVAGRGITHSERERDEVRSVDHKLDGLQLWHALPAEFEEIEPAFYHYDASEMPRFLENEVSVRVMMGEAYGRRSPVKTFAETIYAEAEMKAGQQLLSPTAQECAVYVAEGEVRIEDQSLPRYTMAVLTAGAQVRVTASADSRLAFIGGEPLGERHIYWNFVSSRPERIEQAKNDWREGRFDKVAGDEEEFIPLPE